jgi:hypothetical protein
VVNAIGGDHGALLDILRRAEIQQPDSLDTLSPTACALCCHPRQIREACGQGARGDPT